MFVIFLEETEVHPEKCLSLPPIEANIERYKKILIEGFTPELEKVKFEIEGEQARKVQWAVDHFSCNYIHEFHRNNGEIWMNNDFEPVDYIETRKLV